VKAASIVTALLLLPALASRPAPAQSAGEWRGPAHVWGALCGYCHGSGVALQLRGAKLSAEVIAGITRRGLKQMPAFAPTQINDAELAALAEWISRSDPPPVAKATP
jgi:mono/diheme cytochrome c family protein